jgi:hypothetical protein
MAAEAPSRLRGRLPTPPHISEFPPLVWPTPSERRAATIRAAREAGVSEGVIAAAGGCARVPWGALLVLLIVVVYVVWLLTPRHGGRQNEAAAPCANWTAGLPPDGSARHPGYLGGAGPGLAGATRREMFWTRHGGAIPADEQARRFDAAEKGVPDMAWAEAYWPPNYCRPRPNVPDALPPVPGEPRRP